MRLHISNFESDGLTRSFNQMVTGLIAHVSDFGVQKHTGVIRFTIKFKRASYENVLDKVQDWAESHKGFEVIPSVTRLGDYARISVAFVPNSVRARTVWRGKAMIWRGRSHRAARHRPSTQMAWPAEWAITNLPPQEIE